MAWTYNDYVDYDTGSATRLAKLRSHIKEVSQAIATPSHKLGEFEQKNADTQKYLDSLKAELATEEAAAASVSGATIGWSRGRARPL